MVPRTTVNEVDKRLSVNEAWHDQRWKENCRRLDSIENGILLINKTIRNKLNIYLLLFQARHIGFLVRYTFV